MPDVEQYIREMLRKGYDIYSIRSSLLNSGYTAQQADAAINQVYSAKSKQPSKALLLSVIFVSVFLVIGVSYYFIFLAQPHVEKPTPVPTTPSTPINNTTTPLGSVKNTTTSIKNTTKPTTPAITPGCNNGIQDNGEKGIDCEGPCAKACEFEINPAFATPYPIAANSSDSGESGYAKLEKIKLAAKDDPEKAASQCVLLQEALRDECYTSVADLSKKSKYCESVVNPTNKDTCYVNLVLAGDYSVCDKITDKTVKDACIELKNQNE